jgi:hypothetical protein
VLLVVMLVLLLQVLLVLVQVQDLWETGPLDILQGGCTGGAAQTTMCRKWPVG